MFGAAVDIHSAWDNLMWDNYRFWRGTLEPFFPIWTVNPKVWLDLFWNSPFQSKLGPRLKVVALIDPAIDRANEVLKNKRDSFVVSAYQNTRVFKTFEDFVKNMKPNEKPRAVVVGSPPMFRGTTQPNRDIELQIMNSFPGVAMFIEKPIATGPSSEIEDAFKVAKLIADSNTICSVGWVLANSSRPYVSHTP